MKNSTNRKINLMVTVIMLAWLNFTFAQNKPIECVSGVVKSVAFTFDDGVRPEIHEQILNIAKDEAILVTFFPVGKNIKGNELLKRTIKEGHEIGNHTVSHRKQTTLSQEEMEADIIDFQNILKSKYKYTPVLFRAPFLNYDDRVMKVLEAHNLTAINATVGTKDYAKETTKEYIYNSAINVPKDCDGCIILMHEVQKTVDVFPNIIKFYKDNGYKILTVSQLLASKEPK